MRLTFDREKLLAAFQTAAGVVPTRTTKPVLDNVKLEADLERAVVMATDLEIGVRIDVQGFDVEVGGTVLLPIRRFMSILRETPDEKLYLESDGTRAVVRGAQSEFQLPSQNPEEFPDVATFEEERFHRVPARLFRELIRRTVFATDNESSRYALGGVLLELQGNQVRGVATDGRRLARQEGEGESVGGHETKGNAIIPTRAVQLMERVISDEEEHVLVATTENHILMKSLRTTIYSRLLEGRYPRWRDVFPRQESPVRVELTVGPFFAAVRQAAIVTSEDRRGVDFQFGNGRVVMVAHGAEYGEARVELPIAYEGPETPVKLDPRYLGEFLRVLELEQTFTLQLRDADSPVLCTTNDGYAYVVMPLARD